MPIQQIIFHQTITTPPHYLVQQYWSICARIIANDSCQLLRQFKYLSAVISALMLMLMLMLMMDNTPRHFLVNRGKR
jgi:hypothetical protein